LDLVTVLQEAECQPALGLYGVGIFYQGRFRRHNIAGGYRGPERYQRPTARLELGVIVVFADRREVRGERGFGFYKLVGKGMAEIEQVASYHYRVHERAPHRLERRD